MKLEWRAGGGVRRRNSKRRRGCDLSPPPRQGHLLGKLCAFTLCWGINRIEFCWCYYNILALLQLSVFINGNPKSVIPVTLLNTLKYIKNIVEWTHECNEVQKWTKSYHHHTLTVILLIWSSSLTSWSDPVLQRVLPLQQDDDPVLPPVAPLNTSNLALCCCVNFQFQTTCQKITKHMWKNGLIHRLFCFYSIMQYVNRFQLLSTYTEDGYFSWIYLNYLEIKSENISLLKILCHIWKELLGFVIHDPIFC